MLEIADREGSKVVPRGSRNASCKKPYKGSGGWQEQLPGSHEAGHARKEAQNEGRSDAGYGDSLW